MSRSASTYSAPFSFRFPARPEKAPPAGLIIRDFLRLSRSGFTLVEILVVVAIMAVLMALSTAAWYRASRRLQAEGVAEKTAVLLRQAHTTALYSDLPVRVELLPGDEMNGAVVRAWRYRLVGEWNFGDGTGKSVPYSGALHGCRPKPGAVGTGMELFSPRGGSGYVEIEAPESFNLPDGGWLEARVYLYTLRGKGVVLRKTGSYALGIADGVPFGNVAGSRGGTVKRDDWHLSALRWIKLTFVWDEESSRLFVDDAPVVVGPGMKAPNSEEPLTIGGDNDDSIVGRVDEVRAAAAVPSGEIRFPPRLLLSHDAGPWNAIYFQAGTGNLDPRRHATPVVVVLTEGRKSRRISVSLLGKVRRGEVEDVSERQDEEE